MNNAPKIVVFATQHLQTGGIESHLQQFCSQMSQAGFLIDLVILNAAMRAETENLYRQHCNRVYLGQYGRSRKRIFWLIKIAFKLKFKKYDALYTNGQGSATGLFAKLTKFKNWVHHHHTAGDLDDQATWSTAYINTLKSASHVIACADRNAGDMAKTLERKIDVIPCFSRRVSKVSPTKEILVSEKLKFGYFGRLIAEKGVDVICKLSQATDLQHLEFHLWGEGPSYPAEYFKKFPNVKYNGSYSGLEGLTNAVNILDAYMLISSHGEGLPISLLEIMSFGLPWIATDKGGIREIACDPIATRVIPSTASFEEIKALIQEMATDIKSGTISSSRQVEYYEQHFSSTVLVEKWRNVLLLLN